MSVTLNSLFSFLGKKEWYINWKNQRIQSPLANSGYEYSTYILLILLTRARHANTYATLLLFLETKSNKKFIVTEEWKNIMNDGANICLIILTFREQINHTLAIAFKDNFSWATMRELKNPWNIAIAFVISVLALRGKAFDTTKITRPHEFLTMTPIPIWGLSSLNATSTLTFVIVLIGGI